MTSYTTALHIPKPSASEAPNGPTQIGAVADAVETMLGAPQALTASGSISATGSRSVTFVGAASQTLTLPTAVVGMKYDIHNIDTSDAVTIDGFGSETIEGLLNTVMQPGERMQIVCNVVGTWAIATRTTNVQTFTANGTWTKPAGAKRVTAIIVDGGGGGETKASANASGGAGGRGGIVSMPASSLGTTAAVVIGAGGAAGVDGGKSSFNSVQLESNYVASVGSYVAQGGGTGHGGSGAGKGGFGSAPGGSYGGLGIHDAVGAEGKGDGNPLSSGGGGGGGAATSGAGGVGVYGSGGNGAQSGNASPGTGYGGGGGGAYNGTGGAGTNGVVIVTTEF